MTMESYLDALTTPAVLAVRNKKGSAGVYRPGPTPTALEPAAVDHITGRDNFYIATVGESGWPYVQHRGGEAGFVRILGPTTIGWIERAGNRQYLGTGNITADDKVEIAPSGSVEGDIRAPRVSIADGAKFKGSIDMDRKGAAAGKGAATSPSSNVSTGKPSAVASTPPSQSIPRSASAAKG